MELKHLISVVIAKVWSTSLQLETIWLLLITKTLTRYFVRVQVAHNIYATALNPFSLSVEMIANPRLPTAVSVKEVTSISPRHRSLFLDFDAFAEYQEYQSAYFDTHVLLAGSGLGTCFYFGRCNLQHSFDDGIYFVYSAISASCAFYTVILLVSCFIVRRYCEDQSPAYRASAFIFDSPSLVDFLRDLIAIAGTLGMGLGLLGRVTSGQCPDNVTLWEAQRCNPVAIGNAIPLDHTMYILLMPLLVQAMVTGITYRGVLVSWCVATVAIITCIVYLGAWLEIWVLLIDLWVLVLTFKIEKLARQTFRHSQSILTKEKENTEMALLQQHTEHDLLSEKIKHQSEIFSMKAHEECRLIEKEQEQMVAMIGNIAHDLKTPLQSFTMDLESLCTNEDLCRRKL